MRRRLIRATAKACDATSVNPFVTAAVPFWRQLTAQNLTGLSPKQDLLSFSEAQSRLGDKLLGV